MIEQGRLLTKMLGREKIEKIRTAMTGPSGKIPKGIEPALALGWTEENFGEFSERILLVPGNYEEVRQPFTVIGGWCAVRTADVKLLKERGLIDRLSDSYIERQDTIESRREKVVSVGQFADFLRNAIGIDQIIETIGISSGKEYVAISEERLWSERMSEILETWLRRTLSQSEKIQIRDAIREAEEKRLRYTINYINFARGTSDTNLKRVVDEDIYQDLLDVKAQMLDTAGISIHDLAKRYGENEQTLNSLAIVWGMYIGPYVNMLKKKGYVKTEKGLIVEPWMHATSERRSKDYLNSRIFTGINEYLTPRGINANVGFVPYADVMFPNGQRARQTRTIASMPTPDNYHTFLESLWGGNGNPSSLSLNLSENPVFIWGVNLFPFGETREVLLKMIELQTEYKNARKAVSDTRDEITIKKQRVSELKQEYELKMIPFVEKVVQELRQMFSYTFKL